MIGWSPDYGNVNPLLMPEALKRTIIHTLWTPTSESQPEKPGQYLTTERGGLVLTRMWDGKMWTTAAYPGMDFGDRVRAWMPLPLPWEEVEA